MSSPAPVVSDFRSSTLHLQIILPPADLAPYISTYYRTEVAEGAVVEDGLPPESANLRTGTAEIYEAAIGAGSLRPVPPAIISGPTDRVTHLRIKKGKFWGIGLTPAGWARLVALPADEFVNRFADIGQYASLDSLHGMLDELRSLVDDTQAAVMLMNNTFRSVLGVRPQGEGAIHAVHHAILSETAGSVAQLASMVGMSVRTFERFCKRHFGFPPRTLLRRQRFLRSLSKFMLDPSMKWIDSLDGQYHDQAHFIRDFRSVMGMAPGEFADLDHPVAGAAVNAQSVAGREAMQALNLPTPAS